MKLLPLCLGASLLAAGPALAGDPVIPYQGSRVVVKAKHLIPAMRDGEGYGEKFTFDADFGDRGSLYFSMTISSLGLGDNKMDVTGRLTVDGVKLKYKKSFDEDEWKHSKSKLWIKAGGATLSGTPERLVMTAKKGARHFEIVFTPIARAWRPRNGRVQFGRDRKVTDFTVFPLMRVEAKYDFGEGEKTITGKGWGTHSFTDLAVYETTRWTIEYRGIGLEDDSTFYIREISTGGDYDRKRVVYLLITKGPEILIESYDYNFKATSVWTDEQHENKYKVPESFQITGRDDENKSVLFRGTITKIKRKKRQDMLSRLNSAVRMIAKAYTKPMLYVYDTRYALEIKSAAGVQRISGKGNYEIYHWNK